MELNDVRFGMSAVLTSEGGEERDVVIVGIDLDAPTTGKIWVKTLLSPSPFRAELAMVRPVLGKGGTHPRHHEVESLEGLLVPKDKKKGPAYLFAIESPGDGKPLEIVTYVKAELISPSTRAQVRQEMLENLSKETFNEVRDLLDSMVDRHES